MSVRVPFPALVAAALVAAMPDARAEDLAAGTAAQRWQARHDVAPLRAERGHVVVPIVGPDPFVASAPSAGTGGREAMAEIRMWSEAGGTAQLFVDADHAREEDSVHFQLRSNAWTDVCIPLPPVTPGTRLRIDPPGTNGIARVARLEVSPAASRGVTSVVADGHVLRIEVSRDAQGHELVELQPWQDESDVAAAPVVAAKAGRRVEIPLEAPSPGGNRSRIGSGYAIRARGRDGVPRPLGAVRRIERFHGVASREYVPRPSLGKKGLQVQMVDDAIALGVKQAALNVNLSALMDPRGRPGGYAWTSGGRTFHFNRDAVDAIPAKPLSDAGAVVTLILLAYASGDPAVDAIALHPGYSPKAPNHLGAFNTGTPEGAAWFRATVEFLADRFRGDAPGSAQVANLIVGNEVTAHWYWANEGEVPADVFVADYERTVRLADAAVHAVGGPMRVFLSFDHHWNITYGGNPGRAIPGRRLLDGFNRLSALHGPFGWHVAYHPYPENLFDARTWRDKTATPGPDTPRITFRNLDVLADYLRRPELLLGGRPRRVILSEQGFHSDGTEAGERVQAAAYAYAWRKVEAMDGIDAFILHRHVDHGHEGGLNLGLWRRKPGTISEPGERKPIYDVFKAADTAGRDDAFRFALPVIGIRGWDELDGRKGTAR